MKIAVIDKCPSGAKYEKYFNFDFDLYHLSSKKLPKILKKDVDIEIELDSYNFIVLVGSEAVKNYTKATVTDHAGTLVDDKFIPLTNPAVVVFKPEAKPAFERALEQLHKVISGEVLFDDSGDWQGIQDEDEAYAWVQELERDVAESGVVAVDTETTALYPRDGYVLGISLCGKLRKAAYISSDAIDERVYNVLQRIFLKYKTVFHNSKFDLKMLEYHFGFEFREDYDDTLLMHYLLDETQGTHGLKQLAIKYTKFGDYDKALDEYKKGYCKQHKIKEAEFSYDLIPFDIISEYAAIDTAATLELYFLFKPLIDKNPKLLNVYRNLLVPASTALKEIEENGIPLCPNRLEFARVTLNKSIEDAADHLYSFKEVQDMELARGDRFNPNSVQQLRELLFDRLKLNPMHKLTTTGVQSTDAEVLESLDGQHPIVNSLLTLRKLSKIKNTYIDKIIPEMDKDSRIRTGFNLTSTTSGRLSSSGKFNAQQIPRDEPRVKGSIKAREGYKIVSQDLKTAEVYYAAVLSGDPKLQEVFRSGGDLHSTIAKMVFNLPCEVDQVKDLYPGDRQAAKAITFGILYGSGPSKVAETVTKSGNPMSVSEAREVIEQYFDTFKRLRKWLDETKAQIERDGFLYISIGRKRRLRNALSQDKGIASHEVRSGVNAAIQSLASDINVLAVIDLLKGIKEHKLDAKVFMLVHDSIVAEVHEDHVEAYKALLAKCTQKNRGFDISGTPIGIDQEVGDDYSFGKFDAKFGEQYAEFMANKVSGV
jgi:DNA polymerase I-like protein with 3'-5' exonuclease and polymerase domains